MRISRLTIDKLGVKLYDRVSAVLAELVANSYDADAKSVTVSAPTGMYLASKKGKTVSDSGYEIVIKDDGHGMTPAEMQDHYLLVGAERRVTRGETSRCFGRRVMGRKGVGKLAPFGICKEIEVISSGGERITKDGATGYLTAHIILDRDDMMTPEEHNYEPKSGPLDETLCPSPGTVVKLRNFAHRSVPKIEDLARQLAQRFGVTDSQWTLKIVDSKSEDPALDVGPFNVATLPNTTIFFNGPSSDHDYTLPTTQEPLEYAVTGPEGVDLTSVRPYIRDGDGVYYPIRGWIGYASRPFTDEIEAGVRIYCQGKIAAQTAIFNRSAGFTAEHTIRSYLVGELHLDWLDKDDDLIQTDRRDILWSDELGVALQNWGHTVIDVIGKMSRTPVKQKAWELFRERVDIDAVLRQEFPWERGREIRTNASEVIKMFAENMRPDELNDKDSRDNVVRMGVLLGPLVSLDSELRSATESADHGLSIMASILQRAKVAEVVSFGVLARNRVRIIQKLQQLTLADSNEDALQKLIESAPWLINPEWSPVTANQSLATLRREFQKWLKKKESLEVNLTVFDDPKKRPDFVLTSQEGQIKLIEIKKPHYTFGDADYERLLTYDEQMTAFLKHAGNEKLAEHFARGFHITLVCDDVKLSRMQRGNFRNLVAEGRLEHNTWSVFLAKTEQVHQDFLEAAEIERSKIVALEGRQAS